MKNFLKVALILLFTLSISSCSSDEEIKEKTYLYKSEKVNLTELINNKTGRTFRTIEDSDDYIHSEFETSFFIPEDMNGAELESYIAENQSTINGRLNYLINDIDFASIEFVNGTTLFKTDPNYPLMDECSYDGIQDCVQYAVYEEWTTIEGIICAVTGGLDCIAVEAAACIEKNCF